MNFRPRRREPPELNLIPLIDVLIVLLIFLVLTTTFSREAQLRINLPEASGEPAADSKGIDVVIQAGGRLTIDERETDGSRRDLIAKALKDAAGSQRDPLIVIDADRNATHQAVMTVLDAASQAGFRHVTFAAKAEPGGSP